MEGQYQHELHSTDYVFPSADGFEGTYGDSPLDAGVQHNLPQRGELRLLWEQSSTTIWQVATSANHFSEQL